MMQPSTFLPPLVALAITLWVVFSTPTRLATVVVRAGPFSVCIVHFTAIFLLPILLVSAVPIALALYWVWPTWGLFTRRIGLSASGRRIAAFLAMAATWLLLAPVACTSTALALGARM
jgi:hypothetical protein